MLHFWSRIPEKNYAVTPYIAEYHNTWSNAGFLLLGIWGVLQAQWSLASEHHRALALKLYLLMIGCGIGSVIHHAIASKYYWRTIGADYVCIVLSILTIWTNAGVILPLMSLETQLWISFACGIFVLDHVWSGLRAPWGHVIWHLSSAWAMYCLGWDILC